MRRDLLQSWTSTAVTWLHERRIMPVTIAPRRLGNFNESQIGCAGVLAESAKVRNQQRQRSASMANIISIFNGLVVVSAVGIEPTTL